MCPHFLSPERRQFITWTKVYQVSWCHMAPEGHMEVVDFEFTQATIKLAHIHSGHREDKLPRNIGGSFFFCSYRHIAVRSHECYGVLSHWKLECLSNNFLSWFLATMIIPNLCITCPLWEESPNDQWFPLRTSQFALIKPMTVSGRFRTQRTRAAESVPLSWRHHYVREV